MCGILGICTSQEIDKRKSMEALELLKRRGPDNLNSSVVKFEGINCFSGHTRLKIIDLSDKANQPFVYQNTSLIFNGEIYNFKEIREDLIKQFNISFKTTSDTEVLLRAYHHLGLAKTLEIIKGMFAFIILDQNLRKMFVARDRIGIKPLYYFFDGIHFIAGSEVKAIVKYLGTKQPLNINGLVNFYYHRYVPEPETIYKDIYAVTPGTYIELSFNKNEIRKKDYLYWKLEKRNEFFKEKEIIEKADELLNLSVKEHLVSDVPLAVSFSGGLDSSLLIAIAKKYKTDICGVSVCRGEKDLDEYYGTLIAEHLKLNRIKVDFNFNILKEDMDEIFKYYDVPIACSSIFSTYLVFKEIAKNFKVSLSGDGGDELFGGYEWYLRFNNLFNFRKNNWTCLLKDINFKYKNWSRLFKDAVLFNKYDDFLTYKKLMLNRFEKAEIEEILKIKTVIQEEDLLLKYCKEIKSVKDLMFLDFHTYLRYNLRRADMSSMIHSLENRVPFLDHKIAEFAFSIDDKLYLKGNCLKNILKQVALRYLPAKLVYRPKRGFSAPIGTILKISSAKEIMKFIYKKWETYHN